MALRKILLKSDPALRKVCRPVTDFGPRTCDLLTDLAQTMASADGLGLAAPQVGILRRAVVIVDGEEVVELVNPEITEKSEETTGAFEGCLSCPDERAYLQRPVRVVVRAQDRAGAPFERAFEQMAARAACHEIDHLDGKLFIDLAERVYSDEELDELLERTDAQAPEEKGGEEKDRA
ncbi:MAG: peptide deformylase [Oscillospiraceae bacterium]|nr:peptide deformylase [Oscillospiraceae bacterium]